MKILILITFIGLILFLLSVMISLATIVFEAVVGKSLFWQTERLVSGPMGLGAFIMFGSLIAAMVLLACGVRP